MYEHILSRLGCTSFDKEESPKKKRILYRIQYAGDRRALLQAIQQSIPDAVYKERSSFSSIGHVKCGNVTFIVKPIGGPTEHLHIKAATLIEQGGKEMTMDLVGIKNVPCKVFSSFDELAESILMGLYGNKYIHPFVADTFKDYFDNFGTTFRWSDGTLPSTKNELGKYLGEPLTGLLAFKGLLPFKKAKKFVVPISSCFSGIDCAIILNDGKVIPISNKFGRGAEASFFSNLLPRILEHRREVKKNWILRSVIEAADAVNGDESRAKEIVYNYGVRTILQLGPDVVEDPYEDVYRAIVSGKRATKEIKAVISKARVYALARQSIFDNLTPETGFSSLTGFFTRRMAADLNNCPDSMEFIKKLLVLKDFYQANLNIAKWINGEVEYSFTHSGNCDLTIIGHKGVITDITAKQGLVNYRIDHEKLAP